MNGASFAEGGLSLRAVEKRDLDPILRLRNDQDTWIYLTDPRIFSAADQDGWFSKIGVSSGKWYLTAFDDGHPFVGLVRLDEHDPINRSIRIGADVVPELRGKGFGKRIYAAIRKYCFDHLNVHRLWLCVLETNARAIGLYTTQGFREEGRLREAIWRGGRYVDYIVMSLLDREAR